MDKENKSNMTEIEKKNLAEIEKKYYGSNKESLQKINLDEKSLDAIKTKNLEGIILNQIEEETKVDVEDLYEYGVEVNNEDPSISETDLAKKILEHISKTGKKRKIRKIAKNLLKNGDLDKDD